MVRHADVLETVTIHIPTRRQYRHDETLIDLYDHDLGYLFLRGMERRVIAMARKASGGGTNIIRHCYQRS